MKMNWKNNNLRIDLQIGVLVKKNEQKKKKKNYNLVYNLKKKWCW